MLDELKCFSDVPAREVLKWATINGAEALGLEQQLGSIERGKRPGVVLIDKVERRSEELYISADGVARRLV
jgi:imidazolonepropionase-like amidohydrolase